MPATHFSTNPVHCLRSKFILEDKPPQAIYAVGKEHTMVANPKIGGLQELETRSLAWFRHGF